MEFAFRFSLILLLLVVALGVCGYVLVRLLDRIARQRESTPVMLRVAFRLQRQLLEAPDAATILHAAMQAGMDLLAARGVSFVPFNEWRPVFPVLSLGDVPQMESQDWADRLARSSTRLACKMCQKRNAGSECVLLVETNGPSAVMCTPIRQGGREIGMLNYFMDRPRQLGAQTHWFLEELVSVVDAALLGLQTRQAQSNMPDTGSWPTHQAVLAERARLAREIHDGLAQTLAFLKMETARMQAFLDKGQTERLTQTLQGYSRTLSDAYLDARQAIDDLRREPDPDLAAWLNRAAVDFEVLTGTPVDVQIHGVELSFTPSASVQLVRILQEALANIRKHAGARHVSLLASRQADEVVLQIRDDGCGFSPKRVLQAGRYGLRGMRERAESIGADFQVISQPGQGTTVRLRLPLAVQEQA